jgi:AraC-like DNA-binding protein
MTEHFSTLSGWMIPFSRAMEARGIDLATAMSACNIDQKTLKDQESRIAAECFASLIDYCNQALNSHDFAITVAEHFHPGTFHVVGYAMMSSNTLKDALSRIAQYKRVVSNTCELSVQENGNNLIFEMQIFSYQDTQRLVLSQDSVIAFLGTIIKFSKALVGDEFKANKLFLCYPKPEFETQFITDFFGCEVEFNAQHSGLVLNSQQANQDLIGANPLITQTHEKLLNEFLSRVNKNDLIQQVRSKIHNVLPLGTPSQSDIAAELGMSLRNLQRKLSDKGSSFKDILEDTRKRLAIDHIKQSHLSLCEISYLVGFSNLSNFNRAFKRWTNLTPGEYRNQHLH